MSDLKIPPIDSWLSQMERLSVPFRKYGSFLPEQRELLQRVYEKITNSKKNVWVFAAPPSSGKTHVICLLARMFNDIGQKIAIVVPSNYLKQEFNNACSEVCGGLPDVDVLNLSEYLKTKTLYDFVLVDEAHNLKSFLEFEGDYIKSLSFSLEDEFYQNLISRYLPPNQQFVAQQLSFSSVKDLLDSLRRSRKIEPKLKDILANPTSWSCFLYAWREASYCNIIFVQTDGLCKFKIPRKHLLLFSATPLSDNELSFYCGIPSFEIARAKTVKSASKWKEKQCFCVSITDEFNFADKLNFLKAIIHESNTRTLILFNTFSSCIKAFEALRKDIKDLFVIPSRSTDKFNTYRDFLNSPNGILLTASTVFWEGITVSGLNLLVIFEPPFPRPRLVDLLKKRLYNGQVDMSRRLRQGLGRIGRKKGELGIAITLFDIKRVGESNLQKMFWDIRLLRAPSYQSIVVVHKIFVDKNMPLE
jgi:hypothetical protein